MTNFSKNLIKSGLFVFSFSFRGGKKKKKKNGCNGAPFSLLSIWREMKNNHALIITKVLLQIKMTPTERT